MKLLRQLSSVLMICGALGGLYGVAHAEFSPAPVIQLAQWERMPPDQRREMRQQMRDHWQQLPQDERQAFREQRRERRETYQQMPQEDRSRMRDELRGRRDGWDGGGRGQHGDGYGGRGRR